MQLKASLHIHTGEDKKDGHMINYSIYDLIDEAEKTGFKVLGFTPHQKFVFKEEYARYAEKKGILLIPGVELSLGRFLNKHVIVLNCDKTVEKVKSFKKLVKYKSEHPEVFVLAPHPTYSRTISIGARLLLKYINVFDAVEYSWLYSRNRNANRKAEAIAYRFHKPIISTADVHLLHKLDSDHAMIEAEELSTESVLKAIKEGNFENVTDPKKYGQVVKYLAAFMTRYMLKYLKVKVLRAAPEKIPVTEKIFLC